ncbi:MAG: hypothetical protein LBR22_03805 [Desulfovibrio sp.]|nr:hypothetical protein [Desulfovibrio sp.]
MYFLLVKMRKERAAKLAQNMASREIDEGDAQEGQKYQSENIEEEAEAALQTAGRIVGMASK